MNMDSGSAAVLDARRWRADRFLLDASGGRLFHILGAVYAGAAAGPQAPQARRDRRAILRCVIKPRAHAAPFLDSH